MFNMHEENYDHCIDFPSQPSWKDIENRDEKLEHIEDYFKGVLEELYNDDEIDIMRLEDYLAEIAHSLMLTMPDKKLMISRKSEEKSA